MATAADHQAMEFTAFHLFAGIGGGSLGAGMARANWMAVPGLIRNIGAIDVDPAACEDYRNLTGSPISCMDLFDREQYRTFHGKEPEAGWREATAADIRAAAGGQCPDVVFTSPPCKGFSGLLPNKSAESDKYQALNKLTLRSISLTLEAFCDAPPRILLLENVPRIKSRGKHLLDQIKELLKAHGYACHDADHDCGEIGGLGQHRKRYLLIARHKTRCKPFVYQPPKRELKTIGDVIGPLPLPDDPSMGAMHRLPRLKWLTWLRLALIPAGGDWRDLQKIVPEEYRITWDPRGDSAGGAYSVQDWNDPSKTVIGNSRISGSSPATVSDPRLTPKSPKFNHAYHISPVESPADTVASGTGPSSGGICINDTRLPESKGVFPNRFRVVKWDNQAPVVTGDTDVQCGAPSVSDPRLNHVPRPGNYGVLRMDETCGAIVGGQGVGVSNGPQAIADTRLEGESRSGYMRVLGMDEVSPAVIGSARTTASNGPSVVADTRAPGNNERLDPPPVIIAIDNTWHRPLTTLELMALQSFPLKFADGRPVVLSGKSDSAWRERIGNAVPPEASRRMFEQITLALLQNALGETFVLGGHNTNIWVTPKADSVDRTTTNIREVDSRLLCSDKISRHGLLAIQRP